MNKVKLETPEQKLRDTLALDIPYTDEEVRILNLIRKEEESQEEQ